MPSNTKTTRRQSPIVVGHNTDGKVFSVRQSSAGAYRVMDANAFSKAARRASKVLRRIDGKKD